MEQEEFFVDEIIEKRTRRGKVEYKVRWTGFDPDEATWEPVENLVNCQESIDEFEAKKKQFQQQSSDLSSDSDRGHIAGNMSVSESSSDDFIDVRKQENMKPLKSESKPREQPKRAPFKSEEEESEESESIVLDDDAENSSKIKSILEHKFEGKDLMLRPELREGSGVQTNVDGFLNLDEVKNISRDKLLKYLESEVELSN